MKRRTGRLVVSVHDVAPTTTASIRQLLEALDEANVRPRVLKVIPNAQGRWPLHRCPELIALLQAEARQGSEIILHGYTHEASRRLRGPLATRVRARIFAPFSGEFLSLTPEAMRERLRAGRLDLEVCGLSPQGFCAPGWLATADLDAALVECGFRFRVDMASVRDLGGARRRRHRLPWLGYMGADVVQERLVGLGNLLTRSGARWAPVVKVFFHPPRDETRRAFDRLVRLTGALAAQRQPVTYGELIG